MRSTSITVSARALTHNARLIRAGLPDNVIGKAKGYLKELSQSGAAPRTEAARPDDQLSLSDVGTDEVRHTLMKTDINSLSPIEALNLLYELQQKAGG